MAWWGLLLSVTLAGICYAIFLALLTSPFISIFQKRDEISHLLWFPLSFSSSLCLYHYYSFILILVRFWEKAKLKACVQFAIFHQKSSPVPINYSTDYNLACAPMNTLKQFFSRSPMASLIKPGMLLSSCFYFPFLIVTVLNSGDTILLIFSYSQAISSQLFSSWAPFLWPLLLCWLCLGSSFILCLPTNPGDLILSQTLFFHLYAGDSQIITSSLDLLTYLFNCFRDIIFRWVTKAKTQQSQNSLPQFLTLCSPCSKLFFLLGS